MQGGRGLMGGTGNMIQCQAQVTDVKETERQKAANRGAKGQKEKLQLVNFLMGININCKTRISALACS